jgi:hypothetical protein
VSLTEKCVPRTSRNIDDAAGRGGSVLTRLEVSMQPLLDEEEVAQQLRVTVACLRKWRLLGKGPRYVKVGNRVRYSEQDLTGWLATQPAGGTGLQERNHEGRVRRMPVSA